MIQHPGIRPWLHPVNPRATQQWENSGGWVLYLLRGAPRSWWRAPTTSRCWRHGSRSAGLCRRSPRRRGTPGSAPEPWWWRAAPPSPSLHLEPRPHLRAPPQRHRVAAPQRPRCGSLHLSPASHCWPSHREAPPLRVHFSQSSCPQQFRRGSCCRVRSGLGGPCHCDTHGPVRYLGEEGNTKLCQCVRRRSAYCC